MKGVRGFTLVELLVVISIMSILTTITVSQFQTARKKARDVQRKADLSSVSKALQNYFVDYGEFPVATNGRIGINDGAVWGGTFEDRTVTPPYVYMKVLPKENTLESSYPYCYAVDSTRKKMVLMAKLENESDKECDHNGDEKITTDDTVTCGGVEYCYFVTSPNTAIDPTVASGDINVILQ